LKARVRCRRMCRSIRSGGRRDHRDLRRPEQNDPRGCRRKMDAQTRPDAREHDASRPARDLFKSEIRAERGETAAGGGGANHQCSDVLVGEVWLCSGRSNMEWILGKEDRYRRVQHGDGEVAKSERAHLPILSDELQPNWKRSRISIGNNCVGWRSSSSGAVTSSKSPTRGCGGPSRMQSATKIPSRSRMPSIVGREEGRRNAARVVASPPWNVRVNLHHSVFVRLPSIPGSK
jgi:hypothetical protein